MSNTDNKDEVFTIENSDINVSEIMADIESSLKKRSIDKDEIERIFNLKLLAESPTGHRNFDPSQTANLFEKGIAPPKFTNPRYWFVRGPLKWAIVKFTEIYSFVDKKLSENRIKAFYAVLHELILMKATNQRLERKLNDLYRQVVELRTAIRPGQFENNFYDNSRPLQESYTKSDSRILSLLNKDKSTLVIFPNWENFLNLLKLNQISFQVYVQNKIHFEYIKKQITNQVSVIDDIYTMTDLQAYSNIILHCNACYLPAWTLEAYLLNIKKSSQSGTQCFLRFSNSAQDYYSPFNEIYQTAIDKEKLSSYLREIGFSNIILHTVSKEEFNLITFTNP